MSDISGVGLSVRILASNTFPIGFVVDEFADDSDPLDFAAIQLAETAMGLNGQLIRWAKATPIPMVMNVIPDSNQDVSLAILAEANRVGRGKTSAKDEITAIVTYPDRAPVTLTGGAIIEAPSSSSTASAGRKKSKAYTFNFENKVGV